VRTKWLAVVAVVAVGVVLIALAMRPSGNSAGVALADAAGRIDGESMRMRLNIGIVDASGEYAVSGVGSTAADSSRGTFDLTVTFEGEQPVRMRMLNIGDDFWYRAKQFAQILPRGKRWVHAADNTTPATTLSPSEFARFLSEADDVEELGQDRVLDQPATHYQGVLDVKAMADEIGGESKERIAAMLEEADVPAGAKAGLPVEAWISQDGLPVRMRLSAGGREESLDMTADILEYGVPVEVEPPPETSVIEEAEFERLTGA
jgi:hypothetical protein